MAYTISYSSIIHYNINELEMVLHLFKFMCQVRDAEVSVLGKRWLCLGIEMVTFWSCIRFEMVKVMYGYGKV